MYTDIVYFHKLYTYLLNERPPIFNYGKWTAAIQYRYRYSNIIIIHSMNIENQMKHVV